MLTLKIGDIVRLHKHWLRDGQTGKIIDYDDQKSRYLVQFDRSFEGGGIDSNCLWLELRDFENVIFKG